VKDVGFSIEEVGGQRVLLLDATGEAIAHDRDAADVMGEIFSSEASVVAIPVSRLTPDFFVLSTRVAGDILQKFVTYGVRVAILGDITDAVAKSGPLGDFVRESNRGTQVWFLADRTALRARLAG
jgi:hypothetical protein